MQPVTSEKSLYEKWEENKEFLSKHNITSKDFALLTPKYIEIANDIYIHNILDPYFESPDPEIQSRLGIYYDCHNNKENAEKHYELAASQGSSMSANNLYVNYFKQKRYEEAEYYCKVAAKDKHNLQANENYATFLFYTKNNKELAKKYFIRVIKLGNMHYISMMNSHYNYSEINWEKILLKLLLKYNKYKEYKILLCASCVGNIITSYSREFLINIIQENIQLKEDNTQLKEDNTQLKYQPGGPGYEEAKTEFEALATENSV
jgi:TPR repeat protein